MDSATNGPHGHEVDMLDLLQKKSYDLKDFKSLDPLLEYIGDARYVLLGEASHGTSDYYAWRARITARLIQEKGFSFIGVEGDWPDCYQVNRFIKSYPDAEQSPAEVFAAFRRWPTWMWANWEVVALSRWLADYNQRFTMKDRVGFYGLDVYSLWESMNAIIEYLEKEAPDAVETAKEAYRCFEPFGEDEQAYALHTLMVPENCEEEVVRLLSEVRSKIHNFPKDGEAAFSAEQNSVVMRNAERYYRAMVRGEETWNLRDYHMADTLDRLMDFHGPEAKAIIWAHNTHVGDARATNMAGAGLVNIGQIVRERHQRQGVVLTGFGSYEGSVIAGREWGSPMEEMVVPKARQESWEELFHRAFGGNRLLLTSVMREFQELNRVRGHRAIGVVYNPAQESMGNYVPTILPERYDAFIYLDHTDGLHPLEIHPEKELQPPETYPWGL